MTCRWTLRQCLAILAVSTVGVAWSSESLVQVAEAVIASLGMSEFFMGIILVPLIGNVAEHLVAVQMALKNKMDLAPRSPLFQPADRPVRRAAAGLSAS